MDSGHEEHYFENGKIRAQGDWKEKRVIISKIWHENGNLKYDRNFPKYDRLYSDNGILLYEKNGTLYYDENGELQVQDGFMKHYRENGKMDIHEVFKEKKSIAQKFWNEDGSLSYEFDFPKYQRFYFDNGNLHIEKKGTLYYDDNGKLQVQDGFMKAYYENGKMSLYETIKEKKLTTKKVWYESGSLKTEGDISKGFHKDYFPNGKIAKEVSGKFHYKDGKVILENGTEKFWSEDGNLKIELVFPKYERFYLDDGTLLGESEGTLYYDEQGKIQIQDGSKKQYCENNKLALHKVYKEKKLVGKTVWNESGIITISAELPNRYREFYDDGKIKAEATGTIVEEDDAFKIKEGTYKEYAPNGEVTYSASFKDFQEVSEER